MVFAEEPYLLYFIVNSKKVNGVQTQKNMHVFYLMFR